MTNEWSLDAEWYEALKVVREAGFTAGVPILVRQVEIEWSKNELLPCATIVHVHNSEQHKRRVRVWVNPWLTSATDYRVERLEVLCYVAAVSLAAIYGWGATELSACCLKLGCANTRLMTIRERWRRIGVELDPRDKSGMRSASLVAQMYEDRPMCGWCKGPLVTLSASDTRKDLHEGCHDYILRVVKPQVLAERAARQKAQAL